MNRIMHGSIAEISDYESGKEHKCVTTHYQVHKPKYDRCDDKTGHRRHEQALFITGESVVVTVKDISKFLNTHIFTHPMKQEPMRYVFKECPEEHTSYESKYDPGR